MSAREEVPMELRPFVQALVDLVVADMRARPLPCDDHQEHDDEEPEQERRRGPQAA